MPHSVCAEIGQLDADINLSVGSHCLAVQHEPKIQGFEHTIVGDKGLFTEITRAPTLPCALPNVPDPRHVRFDSPESVSGLDFAGSAKLCSVDNCERRVVSR